MHGIPILNLEEQPSADTITFAPNLPVEAREALAEFEYSTTLRIYAIAWYSGALLSADICKRSCPAIYGDPTFLERLITDYEIKHNTIVKPDGEVTVTRDIMCHHNTDENSVPNCIRKRGCDDNAVTVAEAHPIIGQSTSPIMDITNANLANHKD